MEVNIRAEIKETGITKKKKNQYNQMTNFYLN